MITTKQRRPGPRPAGRILCSLTTTTTKKAEAGSMKTFRIYYYLSYSTIVYKDLHAKSAEEAIKKARIKNIISIKEL